MSWFSTLFSNDDKTDDRVEPAAVSINLQEQVEAAMIAAERKRLEPTHAAPSPEKESTPEPVPAPVPAPDPEPVPVIAPAAVPAAVQAIEPAIELAHEEQKSMSKRVFVACPCEGRTQAEVQQMSAAAVAFCRALYQARGEQIDVVNYADFFARIGGGQMDILRDLPQVLTAAGQCQAAFFCEGCEQDRVLAIVRAGIETRGMPYHDVMYRQA